jgi:hypothetical protein
MRGAVQLEIRLLSPVLMSAFGFAEPHKRGRGWVRGLKATEQPSKPPHLTSPLRGGEEHERGKCINV